MLASASRRSNILLAKRANRPLRLGAGLKIRPSNGEQDYGRDPPTHPETVFMNKIVLGILLGGVLGIFDGLSALISAPETAPDIVGIVIGSTVKGLIAGAVIGAVSRKVQSLPIGTPRVREISISPREDSIETISKWMVSPRMTQPSATTAS